MIILSDIEPTSPAESEPEFFLLPLKKEFASLTLCREYAIPNVELL